MSKPSEVTSGSGLMVSPALKVMWMFTSQSCDCKITCIYSRYSGDKPWVLALHLQKKGGQGLLDVSHDWSNNFVLSESDKNYIVFGPLATLCYLIAMKRLHVAFANSYSNTLNTQIHCEAPSGVKRTVECSFSVDVHGQSSHTKNND